jgi:hypothetical protein
VTLTDVPTRCIEWLVLCEPDDLSALWAFRGLRRRGLDQIAVVTTPLIAHALRLRHHQTTADAATRIELADGRVIESCHLRGVLNRMTRPWTGHWWAHARADASYADAELTAFHLAWLADLAAPVVNRPTACGLPGRLRSPVEWTLLAIQAGLPTGGVTIAGGEEVAAGPPVVRPLMSTPSSGGCTVLVVGGQVCGLSLPDEWRAGCRRLAELADLTLMGVLITTDQAGRACFAGATPLPDLLVGGSAGLDALARVLHPAADGGA